MAPKMKRRDSDEAYDEFFEFSLSSPATKIRRLDAEVAPIAEEEKEPIEIEEAAMGDSSLDLHAMNEERAIVLYKPMDSHLLLSPNRSNVSLQIVSDLIPGLKNGFFRQATDGSAADDSRTAVVPWARASTEAEAEAEAEVAEEGGLMEIEDLEENAKGREQVSIINGWQGQWQIHCREPQQLPLNPTTPVMWSW